MLNRLLRERVPRATLESANLAAIWRIHSVCHVQPPFSCGRASIGFISYRIIAPFYFMPYFACFPLIMVTCPASIYPLQSDFPFLPGLSIGMVLAGIFVYLQAWPPFACLLCLLSWLPCVVFRSVQGVVEFCRGRGVHIFPSHTHQSKCLYIFIIE